MKFLIVLVLFAAAVHAQRPRPCGSPPEWNARILEVDRIKKFALMGHFHYDEINERLAIAEVQDLNGKRSFHDYIMLYKEQKLYDITRQANSSKFQCTASKFDIKFQPVQIPENATFVAKAVLGSDALPRTGVEVNVFHGEFAAGGYVATVTSVGCIPLGTEVYGKDIGFVHTRYFDVEFGVDPERFVPPEDCKEVEHHPGRLPFRHHHLRH